MSKRVSKSEGSKKPSCGRGHLSCDHLRMGKEGGGRWDPEKGRSVLHNQNEGINWWQGREGWGMASCLDDSIQSPLDTLSGPPPLSKARSQGWNRGSGLGHCYHDPALVSGGLCPDPQMMPSHGSEVKVAQSCPTLCNPMDCSLPGSLVHGILQIRKKTGVGSCSLLQGIFPVQGQNPHLPHFRWILYCLSHQGSLRKLEWVAVPFSRGFPWHWDRTEVSHCRRIFYQLSYQGSPLSQGGGGEGGPPNHSCWLRLPSVGYILSLKSVLTHSNRLHPMPSPQLSFWAKVQHCI